MRFGLYNNQDKIKQEEVTDFEAVELRAAVVFSCLHWFAPLVLSSGCACEHCPLSARPSATEPTLTSRPPTRPCAPQTMTAKGLGDVTNQMAALAVGAEGATKPAEVCRRTGQHRARTRADRISRARPPSQHTPHQQLGCLARGPLGSHPCQHSPHRRTPSNGEPPLRARVDRRRRTRSRSASGRSPTSTSASRWATASLARSTWRARRRRTSSLRSRCSSRTS